MKWFLVAVAAALLRREPGLRAAANATAGSAPRYPVVVEGAGLPSAASGYEFDRVYPAAVDVTLSQSPGARMYTWKTGCLSCNQVQMSGVWEPAITTHVLKALQADPSPAFLDVGSQVGYYSVLAASKHVPVLAIEAYDQNAFLLRKTAVDMHYPTIHLVEKAATDPAGAAGRGCIGGGGPGTGGQANGRMGSSCMYRPRLATIDGILATEFPSWAQRPITTLKMDIETFEWKALQGTSALLSDPKRKPCTMHIEYLYAPSNGKPRKALCDLLRSYGYTIVLLHGSTGQRTRILGESCPNGDIFAVATPRPACKKVQAAVGR